MYHSGRYTAASLLGIKDKAIESRKRGSTELELAGALRRSGAILSIDFSEHLLEAHP